MKKKIFYDIHMHTFDLSHPDLSAFLLRYKYIAMFVDKKTLALKKGKLSLGYILLPLGYILLPIILLLVWIPHKVKKWMNNYKEKNNTLFKRIVNTLSFYEIPHEYQFLVMENYLKNCSKQDDEDNYNKIKIGNNYYDKIIICPLIIDFGYKNIPKQVHYSITPKHPVANQTGDIFYAIRTYFRFNMVLDEKRKRFDLSPEISDWYDERDKKCFEIYPFMGLDTRNYENVEKLKELLDKYFRDFKKEDTAEERKNRLFEKMGMLDSNMYRDKEQEEQEEQEEQDKVKKQEYIEKLKTAKLSPDYQYAFAGIKVYPQLGFDPYPESSDSKKVKFLYEYCIEKRIPIITHCSDGGYKIDNNNKLTSPLTRWTKVLDKHEELTLNFAHFGHQECSKKKWRNAIIELTKKYDNVYTDISCNNMKKKYYDKLKEDLENNTHLQDKVLFGSDFSINMLVTDTDSYNENLEVFIKAKLPYKDKLCELNPERFLFGK